MFETKTRNGNSVAPSLSRGHWYAWMAIIKYFFHGGKLKKKDCASDQTWLSPPDVQIRPRLQWNPETVVIASKSKWRPKVRLKSRWTPTVLSRSKWRGRNQKTTFAVNNKTNGCWKLPGPVITTVIARKLRGQTCLGVMSKVFCLAGLFNTWSQWEPKMACTQSRLAS